MNSDELLHTLVNDPATPCWVRDVLNQVIQRDPVDAANGMGIVADFADKRADESLTASIQVLNEKGTGFC